MMLPKKVSIEALTSTRIGMTHTIGAVWVMLVELYSKTSLRSLKIIALMKNTGPTITLILSSMKERITSDYRFNIIYLLISLDI